LEFNIFFMHHEPSSSSLEKLYKAVLSARASLEVVEKWSLILAQESGVELDDVKKKVHSEDLALYQTEEEKIFEGFFDGQFMIGPDAKEYPVPANYASKSKLVRGDKLKLTIKPNGAFVYKQIELAPRKMILGKLILDGNQYKVLTDDKTYSVLYASVTFYKGNVGDEVALIVPENEESPWAAIENILPAVEKEVKISKKKENSKIVF